MTDTLICIVGPTAIGKTQLSLVLAEHYGTEILSADSRQFYREMTVGTAVPSQEELQRAQHHFVQHKSVHDPYSVGQFERDALAVLKTTFKSRNKAILVGGSGLYVDAVTKGLDHFPEVDPSLRTELNTLWRNKGLKALQQELSVLDPEHWQRVDRNNPHRLIRALEICLGTGKPYSSFLNKQREKRNFRIVTVGLRAPREILYARIEARVEAMMKTGLLEEARALYPYRDLNALQTVGYRELFAHFNGQYDLDTAVMEIKKNTRRFAKRQGTWFRKNQDTHWLDHDYKKHALLPWIDQMVNKEDEPA
ncbi:tRNA (adenosine(37)-N6)-dimethylallyltransferase MiaA [Maribacter sp. 2307ULW6-5]|uniref:tRNA (adenosine(37)-N6)-dimethylallyltransferase MiaA n=1 Tax=Maribacter sp. 2307ULW6-5 TaxID=3386275 RepID=UPI0039BCDB40